MGNLCSGQEDVDPSTTRTSINGKGGPLEANPEHAHHIPKSEVIPSHPYLKRPRISFHMIP
jgi:hypothetical protein